MCIRDRLTDAVELLVDSWNILISHLVGEVWAVWLRKLLHEKWERKLGRLAFQQGATVCHLFLFLCLRQLQHKADTGILWPHWCDIPENMYSWDIPVLFPAGCAWVAFTLMTERVEVFLLDSYLLCCVLGALCLHLEPFNEHLNVPLPCQEWIPCDGARLGLHSSWSSPAVWVQSNQLCSRAVHTEDWQLAKMPCE